MNKMEVFVLLSTSCCASTKVEMIDALCTIHAVIDCNMAYTLSTKKGGLLLVALR